MFSYLKPFILFIRQPNINKGFQILFALFLAYFAVHILHYHYFLITFPYPIIYREGAMMATTTMLLHGVNPYNFILEPQYSNLYGIIYPLIVWPFAAFFGGGLVVHRALTGFFILASCLIIFFVLYKKKTPLLLNVWAILTLYASLLFPLTSTPCVDPASTGLFFMLLTVFIPFFLNYSYISLFLSIICGLLAFYTKSYFLLGVIVMASYLFFFISKKKSLLFGFSFFMTFAISAFVMNYFFPSYFDDCFFCNYNVSGQSSMMIVLERQLHQFADLHKGVILLMSVILVYSLVHVFISGRFKGIKEIMKVCLFSFRWKDWAAPLIIYGLPLDIYAGIFFAAVLIFSMGKHYGANLWYFFQLFSPFLLIFTAWITGRFMLWPVVFSFLLIYNLFSLTRDDNYRYFDKNTPGWHDLEKLVKTNGTIFNSALIAPLLIQENREIFDDGTMYYVEGGKRNSPIGRFLPEDKRVYMAQAMFLNKVQNMVRNKKFDLVIIEAGYSSDVMPDSIKDFYKYVGSILVNVPQDRKYYMMTVWAPV